MNGNDLDRRLRQWLEPGADQARETVVWAAIDQVELTPQRPRWRSRVGASFDRIGPMLRVMGVAAAVLLAAVIVAALSGRNVGGPVDGTIEIAPQDLDSILVWEDTKPPTWHLDNLVSNPAQVLVIPARSMADASWIEHPAFRTLIGGRYTDFTGQDAIFMSWGTVYSSVGGARDAYDLLAAELGGEDGWGLGSGDAIDLGDEGVVLTGTTTALMGRAPSDPVASRMYLWRIGNVVLSLGAWFDYDEVELEAVARSMDERAHSAAAAP